jgi:hypothetical protein
MKSGAGSIPPRRLSGRAMLQVIPAHHYLGFSFLVQTYFTSSSSTSCTWSYGFPLKPASIVYRPW